jgi:hypothetical protein
MLIAAGNHATLDFLALVVSLVVGVAIVYWVFRRLGFITWAPFRGNGRHD